MPEKKSKFKKAIEDLKYIWEAVLKPDGRGLLHKISFEISKHRINKKALKERELNGGRDYE